MQVDGLRRRGRIPRRNRRPGRRRRAPARCTIVGGATITTNDTCDEGTDAEWSVHADRHQLRAPVRSWCASIRSPSRSTGEPFVVDLVAERRRAANGRGPADPVGQSAGGNTGSGCRTTRPTHSASRTPSPQPSTGRSDGGATFQPVHDGALLIRAGGPTRATSVSSRS